MNLLNKISILISTFLLGAIQLSAQSSCEDVILPQEHVVLHLDRNVCLAGETLWFKAWCMLDGKVEQNLSKVLYVELFDESQEVIVQEKYLLSNNKAAGSFRIPEDVPSKYYFLRAYTRYMRNFSSSYYHYQQLTIVNPLIEGGSISTHSLESDDEGIASLDQQKALNIDPIPIQIELQKEIYQVREKISFHLKGISPITAELSTSVRLQGLGNLPSEKVIKHNNWLKSSCQEDPYCRQFAQEEGFTLDLPDAFKTKKTLPRKIDQLQWPAETRGLTISGLVQDDQKDNITGAVTMVSVLQKTPLLYMGTTDEQGNFTVPLHHLQDQKDLFVGTPKENNTVLIRNDFDSKYPKVASVPIRYDSVLHSLLEFLNLQQQLERIYPKNASKSVYENDRLNIASTNIVEPDSRIVLGDFVKLSTMTEVFREITPGVRLHKKEGKENLSVFNFEQQKWYDSPLILLDNVPVFDIEELLKVNPAKVVALEVYNSDYILGDYVIGAIVSIITSTDDFANYQWGEQIAFTTFKAFSPPKAFEQVLHTENSHYPDYRPVLYWQPDVILNEEKVGETISFYTPDRPGIYEILVQGLTNKGEPCFGHVTFEVALNN